MSALATVGRRGFWSRTSSNFYPKHLGSVLGPGCSDEQRTKDLELRSPMGLSAAASSFSRRYYHTTARQEIVPIIIVGAGLAVVGRYAWRANQRMDEEWEEYEAALFAYEQQQQGAQMNRTVAVDFGSLTTKLATTNDQKSPEILVSREGDRHHFNGVYYDDMKERNTETALRGRLALEKYYPAASSETSNSTATTVTPWDVLKPLSPPSNDDSAEAAAIAGEIINAVLQPHLKEAWDSLPESNPTESDSSHPIRTVLSLPTPYFTSASSMAAISKLLEQPENPSDNTFTIIPNPVTAVWGAELLGLLPKPIITPGEADSTSSGKTLVVDVGGHVTQVSLISSAPHYVVDYTASIPWGGETIIQTVMDQLLTEVSETSGYANPAGDAMVLSALAKHTRDAVTELSSTTRVAVHVPYIFANPEQHHFDTELVRSVVDGRVQDGISEWLREQLADDDTAGDSALRLSPHMPSPNSTQSLFMSLLTEALEKAGEIPSGIPKVLLVGGASRVPVVESSVRTAVEQIWGPATGSMVVPDNSLKPDLVALGGATLLPSYDYDLIKGLHRR